MLTYSFAEGAELRLVEHHHADELFALMDQNRSYLCHGLPEWDVQKSLDECKAVIKSSLEQEHPDRAQLLPQQLIGVSAPGARGSTSQWKPD